MKYFLIVVLLYICSNIASQPFSGLKLGSNLCFIDDSKTVYYPGINEFSTEDTYTPKLGWQIGYSWNINLNNFLSISIESMLNRRKATVYTYRNGVLLHENMRDIIYFSVPIAINYYRNNVFTGVGYEFGYDTGFGNGLALSKYEHSIFLQAGYKIWEFDFVAKYGLAQNRKPSATQNNYSDESYAEPSGSNSYYGILQLSVIYNLGKKTNND